MFKGIFKFLRAVNKARKAAKQFKKLSKEGKSLTSVLKPLVNLSKKSRRKKRKLTDSLKEPEVIKESEIIKDVTKNDFFTVLPDEQIDEDFLDFVFSENALNKKEDIYYNNLIKSLNSVKGYDDELDRLLNEVLEKMHNVDKKQLVTYLENLEIEREDIHVILFSSDDEKIKMNMNKLEEFLNDIKEMIGVNS